MTKFIKTIEQLTDSSQININLYGKNLIIVGNNGAGKTKFLNILNTALKKIIIEKNLSTQDGLRKLISQSIKFRDVLAESDPSRITYNNNIKHYNNEIEQIKKCHVTYTSSNNFEKKVREESLVYRFFEAYRAFTSSDKNLLKSIDELYSTFEREQLNNISTSNLFESFLVSMSNYALIEKGAGEVKEFDRVSRIILKIEQDLQTLFEDNSLRLNFNRKSLRMEIIQGNRECIILERLPSGYASVLAVYTELVMLSELGRTQKNEIRGIVLIDEIDAHLHVTVQKKVFDFFSTSFPGIQFIISTHSPFVVQSVSDAIIYNLSTNEQLEDLSAYSYTSIIKGLLGETANSAELEKLLKEVDTRSKDNDFGPRFVELVEYLDTNIAVLDPRAKAILMSAKSRHVDWVEGEDNV
ncbi:AAA family ATPase [Serratia fonticola]|uniref:AAA family ATPase n=1 Tax=Serratia fonticola TaxID=47917 RepID=UPI00217B9C70|nr:AAA family ATPase [Serratia fonticola]CAI1211823.1 Predicted ATP-binding protein involved in virulence [Serratia fonticola]CAI1218217.1 Predicted ATP-binding protein involved in virulence [Serratia fonticola]